MKIINKVFLILLVSIAASSLFAQSAVDPFVQKIEGAGTLTATVQSNDGGYVTISKIDISNFIARKIRSSGQKQWERTLTFDVESGVNINAITQTTDGGFVLAGQVGSSGATLIKLRPNGTTSWKKSLTVSGVGFDYLFSAVSPTPDGGVIAIGRRLMEEFDSSPRLFIATLTAAGDIVWEKSFGTLLDNFFGPAFVIHSTSTSDGGLIIAFSIPGSGMEAMKITNSGNVVWQKLFGFGSFGLQSIGATSDGGAILVSTISKKLNVITLKTDGTISWKAKFSVQVPGDFQFVSNPTQTPDGGYVLTGSTKSGNGFIAKINSSQKIGFKNNFLGSGKAVFATSDGGFFLFGDMEADILALRLNSEGIVPGCDFFAAPGNTIRTSFGPLKVNKVNITASNVLSFESSDFRLTSVVTNHPGTTVCK